MDPAFLAQSVTSVLSIALPYLLKMADKAAEEIAKHLGGEAWDKVKALWSKIRPKLESQPAALDAAKDVAEAPDNELAVNSLKWQLQKLFKEDEAFASEIAILLQDKVVQRVIAEHGSLVRDVKQVASGTGSAEQQVEARDQSTIEGVEQRKEQ